MEDQTNFLLAQEISAGSIGEDKAVNAKIENGECCVVFASQKFQSSDRPARLPLFVIV